MRVPIPQVSDQPAGQGRLVAPGAPVPIADVAGQQAQQLGAGALRAGTQLSAIAMQMNEDHALATVRRGENLFGEHVTNVVDNGYLQQVGQDAVEIDGVDVKPTGRSRKVIQGVEERAREIEAGMSSELAKRIFRERTDRNLISIRGRVIAHEAKQHHAYALGQLSATAEGEMDRYVAFGDPESYLKAVANLKELSSEMHHTPAERDQFLLDKKTAMNAGVLDRLLKDDPSGDLAQEHLNSLDETDITATMRQKARAKINEAQRVEKVKRITYTVFDNKGYGSKQELRKAERDYRQTINIQKGLKDGSIKESDLAYLPGFSISDDASASRSPGNPPATDPSTGVYRRMMIRIQKLYEAGELDAEGRRKAEALTDELVNREARQRAVEDEELLRSAERILEATGRSVDSPEFQAENPDLFERLRSNNLMSSARKMGKQRATDPVMYDQLMKDAYETGALARMSPQDLFSKYYYHLDRSAWAEAQRLFAAVHPDKEETKVVGSYTTPFAKQVSRWMFEHKLISGGDLNNPRPKGTNENKYYAQTMREMDEWIGSNVQQGTKVPFEMVEGWLTDRELYKVRTPGHASAWWFSVPVVGATIWLGRELFADTDEQVREYELLSRYRELQMNGTDKEVRTFKEKYLDRATTEIDGDEVRVTVGHPRKVGGLKGEPASQQAQVVARNLVRLDALSRAAPPEIANQVAKQLVELGALDVTLKQTPQMRGRADEIFAPFGLGSEWGPISEQWKWLKRLRAGHPGHYHAPNDE